jgi:transposase
MVHPFATKQLRQPAAPGTKTDLTDLRAIIRAIMVGYGTQERELPERWQQWRLLSREREDRVRKRAKVRVQVQERLQALMPGYSALFGDLWKSPIALALAGHYGSAAALRADGHEAILEWLRQANHAARRETVARVLQWASLAAPPDPCPEFRHRLLCDQFHLAQALDAQIALYEADLAHYLVDTPLVLLLAIPGINVVSAASYGAELGPIQHYPDPKKIAGRAGLYPSRYQSDEVDRPDGPLVGRRNARLRDAILEIAHNLIRCNEHFKAWAHIRRNKRWPATKIHVAVGTKFTRISYWMLAGRMVFQHPSMCGGDAVLAKLTDFATRAGLEPRGIRDLLLRASRQLPKLALEGEARALVERLPRRRSRRRPQTDQSLQPVLLGDVLREVIRDLAPGVAIEAERSQRSQRNARRAPH